MLGLQGARASEKALRWFCLGCARSAWGLLSPDNRAHVEAAESCIDDPAGQERLRQEVSRTFGRKWEFAAARGGLPPDDFWGREALTIDWLPALLSIAPVRRAAMRVARLALSEQEGALREEVVRGRLKRAGSPEAWQACWDAVWERFDAGRAVLEAAQASMVRDALGNPFRPTTI